jgi:glycosyltransferase involved in cell wall biosynthesis
MTLSLTLVVPCYREARRLQPERFVEFLDTTEGTRLLFVDDGSPDETPRVLAALAAQRPARIEMLALTRNVGKGEAVRRGLLHAMETDTELVGFWDADLATPLELVDDFRSVLATHSNIHWVLGSRWRGLGRHIHRGAGRHYTSRVFATVASLILGLPIYDTQCGAKVFRADDLLRRSLAEPFRARWVFDVELLARLVAENRSGLGPLVDTIAYELPLSTWVHDGHSHLGWTDFLVAIGDLYGIWARYLRAGISGKARRE